MKHKVLSKHNKQKKFSDKVIYIAAIVEPLFVLPQILQIFKFHDASSISLLTWLGFDVLTAIWVWWAFINKERVVLIYQGLYFVFQSIVLIGALMFGGKWL